jgi:hypothetical protein
VINSTQEMNLVGFDKKETLTLFGKNIIDKYQENNKIYFIMAFKSSKEIRDNAIFNFNYMKNDDNNIYKSNCSFNIDSQNIICEDIDNKLTIDDDIIIKSTPEYIILNNQTLYFLNFENKRTYTIKAGLIEKLQCTSELFSIYSFNLIKTSSKYIPNDAEIEIPIIVGNSNDKAFCIIKNSDNYNMSCIINGINCPSKIILINEEIKPNETLYYPNTTFFKDFNNKRTITIKSGKIQKGKCDSSSNYNFTFIQNYFDYNTIPQYA